MGYIGNQPAETPINQILETDFKIGEDDETKIDFADANTINFHANNAKEMVLVENALTPGTSDGTALGTTSLMWSDVFLASGSVINLNNGDVTLTHSSNTLTVAGGTLATAALTSSTITASGIIKTDDTTNATSTTDGSLQTDGGLSVALDTVFGDDVSLLSDDAVLNFGADSEIKLTHIADTGLRLTDSGGTPTLQLHDQNESIASDGSKVIITSGGTAFSLPTSDGSNGQALVTNGGAVLSFADVASNTPSSADGQALGSASAEWSDLFLADGGQILFGNDQEITLTHVADDGLVLKHVGTADGKEPSFSFHAGDNDIAANDVLGSIFFKAPDEGAGTDAILVAAGIEAVSEGDFSASSNATKLSFLTGSSEAAAEKMSLSSGGNLTISGDLTITGDDLFMNTNTAGHILVGDDTNYNPVAVSGDITLASNGAVTIAAGAVEHGMLADDIISGQDEITSGFAAADELMYSDAGTIKRVGLDTLATKLFSVASAGTVAQASDHMLFLDGGATGDVIVESIDDFLSAIAGSGVSVSSSQLTVAAGSDTIDMGDGFVIEDGDGTEVTITENKEIKFVEGGGIDIDFTDTDNGTDADPFDLTFTINAAQTGITSLLATDIKIGEDDETKIDFEDANKINFYANNAKEVELAENSLSPGTSDGTALGTTSLMWSDLFLADAAVINFNNGNVTLTHSSAKLTSNADIDLFRDANNADVALRMGTSATESFEIKVTNGSSNKAAESVTFTTATAESGGNAGKMVFNVDGSDILTIDDGGIDFESGKTISVGGTDVILGDNLNGLTAGAIADGDSIAFIDANDSNATKKEAVADLATLFAGDGLAASSSVLGIDLATNSGLEIDSNKLQIAKGISQHDVPQFTSGVVDDDFLRVAGTVIEGRSAAEVASDIGASTKGFAVAMAIAL